MAMDNLSSHTISTTQQFFGFSQLPCCKETTYHATTCFLFSKFLCKRNLNTRFSSPLNISRRVTSTMSKPMIITHN